ncbi:hypothetical protein AGMMS49975_20070 [Clostridia bacterium]|nr:hypothetical protein AGMMS49975_20070 [Clostridia bacterium]
MDGIYYRCDCYEQRTYENTTFVSYANATEREVTDEVNDKTDWWRQLAREKNEAALRSFGCVPIFETERQEIIAL